MIRVESIMAAIADAVRSNPPVIGFCEQYGRPLSVYVGHRADQPLFAQDNCPAFSVAPSDQAYNIGRTGEARTVPLTIRWAVWNEAAPEVDGVTTFSGVLDLDELGHLIIEAIRAMDIGDDLTSAEANFDTTASWPLCQASAELTFTLARGTAYEPDYS